MKNRHYLYIKCFSDFGSNMDLLVLNVMILSLTHSPIWLSVNLALRTLGGALSSLYAGNLADRWDRRKLMIISDVLRMIVIVLVIVTPDLWSVLCASFAIGVLTSYFSVSFGAITPDMFGENLISVNALIGKLQSISSVTGFIGAGLLGMFAGPSTALYVDGISYLLSAVALLQMEHSKGPRDLADENKPSRSIFRDVREISVYARKNRVFLLVAGVFFADMIGASVLNVAAPLMAERIDPHNQTLVYGVVWGAVGLGTVIAMPWVVKRTWITRDLQMGYWCGTLGAGICFVSFLESHSFLVSVVFALAAGFFETFTYITIPTIFQQVPNEIRGRIFGFQTMIRSLGFAIGYVVTPIIIRGMGYTDALLVLQGAVFSIVIIAIVLYKTKKEKLTTNQSTQPSPIEG